VNEILSGKRGVTSKTAWLLAPAFGTTPELWVPLQSAGPGDRPAGHGLLRRWAMDLSLPLDQRSVEEKRRAIERLWEDLARTPSAVP